MRAPAICCIGSTDPWNAAGLGLDIRALAELGARSVVVVAGVTAQDRHGLQAAMAVAPDVVAAQFEALRDAPVAAYRIGAVLDAASLDVIAAHLAHTSAPVVYDPVFAPSAGGTFADEDFIDALRSRLVPLAAIVTPNLSEAAALCKCAVDSVAEMEHAARTLRELGATAALITGGHRSSDAIDVLADAQGNAHFDEVRLPGTLRGTGCLLAVALAAALADGASIRQAVPFARTFVRSKLACPQQFGGMNVAY